MLYVGIANKANATDRFDTEIYEKTSKSMMDGNKQNLILCSHHLVGIFVSTILWLFLISEVGIAQ